jgi:hypothetical protein
LERAITVVKNITLGKFREVLVSLGYTPYDARSDLGDTIIFRNPNRRLRIFLPKMADEEFILPVDLHSARSTLEGDGVIKDDYEFDSLFLIRKGDRLVWTDPKTGKESKVTAAAGESDGLVVVKQNGTLLPCPVGEVRRVKRAATAGRN